MSDTQEPFSARDPNLPPRPGKEWGLNGRASDVPIEPGGEPSPFADLDDVPPEEFADPSEVPPDEDEPYSNSDIDTRKTTVTFIKDETGQHMRRVDMTLPQLAEHIRFQTAASKMALPWLKLALFGNQRSEKNSLRTNSNVLQISGIEVEHDAGEVAFDTALATVLNASIRCILYTSPSYAPGVKERWRILLPLSQNREPEVREKMVARVNGLFAGKLAEESFVLSQGYLYGSVNNNPHHRVEVIDSRFLDLCDDLYAGSIYKDGSRVGGNGNGASHDFNGAGPQHRSRKDDDPQPVDRDKIEAALNVISSDCHYKLVWMPIGGALYSALGDSGFDLFDRWSAKAPARYNAEKCKESWIGFRSLREYTTGTIYHFADQADPAWRQRYEDEEARGGYARMAAGSSTGGPGLGQTAPGGAGDSGGTLGDFYAYMPNRSYIFVPTREPWPLGSVNSYLPKVPVTASDGTPVVGADGKPKWLRPSDWLDRHRAVEQMTWAPGEPLTIDGRLIAEGGWFSRPGATTFNMYRPPTERQGNAANAERWVELVERIYPGDAGHIIAYCAHRIQHPAVKINHGVILSGSPGIGKDTLLEPLKLGVGPWNFREVSPHDIMSGYNDFMRCVVLRISEAHDLGDVNRYAFYDRMKTLLATPPDVIRVNGKYVPQHCVANVAGVIYTTNHRFDGVYLPADDRRTYVAWSESTKDDFVTDFWSSLWAWYRAGGLEDVVAYLAEYDLSKFDPKAPPKKTDAFWQIVSVGAAPEEAELADVLDGLGAPDKAKDAEGRPCGPVVTTLDRVIAAAQGGLYEWLCDRKNRRGVPHRFERCGYVPVRNDAAKDGLWVIGGKRQKVFGRLDVPLSKRIEAAGKLGGG